MSHCALFRVVPCCCAFFCVDSIERLRSVPLPRPRPACSFLSLQQQTCMSAATPGCLIGVVLSRHVGLCAQDFRSLCLKPSSLQIRPGSTKDSATSGRVSFHPKATFCSLSQCVLVWAGCAAVAVVAMFRGWLRAALAPVFQATCATGPSQTLCSESLFEVHHACRPVSMFCNNCQ